MLKTVLLLDGSAAMNSTAEYSPNYLFAIRQPLFRFVRSYLNSTALASLGLVVIRDGIAKCLFPCTTNIRDLLTALELHYFLYGGEGSLSLENGLRASLAELLENPQQYLLGNHRRNRRKGENSSSLSAEQKRIKQELQEDGKEEAENPKIADGVECQVLFFSASVTVIDPTDILRVVRVFTKVKIKINIVSILGAVHIFQECADRTGGTLHCPQSYKHLCRILQQLAVGHFSPPSSIANDKRFFSRHLFSGKEGNRGHETVGQREGRGYGKRARSVPPMIKIGFPMWCEVEEDVKIKTEASFNSPAVAAVATPAEDHDKKNKENSLHHLKKEIPHTKGEKEPQEPGEQGSSSYGVRLKIEGQQGSSWPMGGGGDSTHTHSSSSSHPRGAWRLCCPECGQIQTSVPSTCSRCGLRLCSVPFLYSMFVKRNHLLPPVRHYRHSNHHSSCQQHLTGDAGTTETEGEKNREAIVSSSCSSFSPVVSPQSCGMCTFRIPAVVVCCHCAVYRCEDCQKYCEEVLSLCPTCISLQ